MEMTELRITDVVVGTGKEAVKGALLKVHYHGYLDDGTLFESSLDHGRMFEFVLGAKRVIRGWDLGLMGMREGGTRTLYVPSHLAYGERTKPTIPAHSNLTFQIELFEVLTRDE